MPLMSSFYGMYINSQDFSCLLEKQPFLPKTLVVLWKLAFFTKNEGDIPKRQIKFIAAWTEIHKDELIAKLGLAINEEPLYKIEPLR